MHVSTLSRDCKHSVVWAELGKNYCSINIRRHWASFPPLSWKGTLPALFMSCTVRHTRLAPQHAQPDPRFTAAGILPCDVKPNPRGWNSGFLSVVTFQSEGKRVRAIHNTKSHGTSPVAITLSRASVWKMPSCLLSYEKFLIPVRFYRHKTQRRNLKAQITFSNL